MTAPVLEPEVLSNICRLALAEDIGSGDATTLAVVPEKLETEARFITRQLHELDRSLDFQPLVQEGDFCKPGTELAVVCGKAQPILTGERCALNFMQRLSGIATMTRQYVLALGDSKTKLLDTRKTTPGLRMLEKYAVKVGGAQNHRFGLFDRIMIKDNHREMAKTVGEGSIAWAVRQCREKYPKLEIEIEADNLDEVRQAADAGVEYILLDNMSNDMMVEAIKIIAGRAKTEASGNITLENVAEVARRILYIESMGGVLKFSDMADKIFKSNLLLLDTNMPRILASMVMALHIDGISRISDLADMLEQKNPLKVKDELVRKHGFYRYKLRQLLLAAAWGMRPTKQWDGQPSAIAGYIMVDGDGEMLLYTRAEESVFADYLFTHTRIEKGSPEGDRYGLLERENGAYYLKLNLKISLTKR